VINGLLYGISSMVVSTVSIFIDYLPPIRAVWTNSRLTDITTARRFATLIKSFDVVQI